MSACRVYIRPEAWREIKELPGHLRQRVRRANDEHAVDVLGVRKRPPYDYGDLTALLAREL